MKWTTLQHNGPVFPPDYKYQGYKIKVANKSVVLSKDAEEVATFWAQKINTDYIKDPVCIKNFWSDFKPYLPKELQSTKFPQDWDFTAIVDFIEAEKLAKKNRSKAEKLAEKEAKEKLKETYGYAILNGERIPLGNYQIEPPGLFMGRGDHPYRFRIKKRIRPEDVEINHSLDLNPPKAPDGHSWKAVVEKDSFYTARWVEPNLKVGKRILFSGDSILKQKSDQQKFNKAIKLAKKLDYVNKKITELLDSPDYKTRVTATAAKLITDLAIRVGTKKGEDQADTVGATSLRFEHIKVNGEFIELNFLGKDSIRYTNRVKFHPSMIRNITELLDSKKKGDKIFSINPGDVNQLFKSILPGISAKVFRTAYGSKLLAQELQKLKNLDKMTVQQKLKAFTDANLTVAVKLNHQSAVPKKFNENLKTLKQKLNSYKSELKSLKSESKKNLKELKIQRDEKLIKIDEKHTGKKRAELRKKTKESYNKKVESYQKKIDRLTTMIENYSTKIETKKKTKGIALGTSKTNYSDPRIAYSFCADNEIPLNKLFTATLQKKFEWARESETDFYKKYPNI